jgi:hypothetical protein
MYTSVLTSRKSGTDLSFLKGINVMGTVRIVLTLVVTAPFCVEADLKAPRS